MAPMLDGTRARAVVCLGIVLLAATACQRGFGRQYEYEEQVYLALDGSASVVVNASIPALVALRGLKFDTSPDARIDRDDVRGQFANPLIRITRVSRPWRRDGRRFVQVRFDIDDVKALGTVAPTAWSTYGYVSDGQQVTYTQKVGASANTPPAGVNWSGSELVGFRLHMPSRISFHNAPTHEVERGNILTYEQTLAERLRGAPIDIEVRMDAQSIFARTMTVFGLAAGAAVVLLVVAIWWVRKKGQERPTANG
jgi:hypothetical protein